MPYEIDRSTSPKSFRRFGRALRRTFADQEELEAGASQERAHAEADGRTAS